MAFPTTSVIDTFLGASWDPFSNWLADPVAASRVLDPLPDTGVGIKTQGAAFAFDQWFSPYPSLGPDVEAYVEIPTAGAGNITRLYARLRDPSNSFTTADAYIVQATVGGSSGVYRLDNGIVGSTLGTFTASASATGFGIEVTGTGATVTCKAYERISGSWSNTQTYTDTSAGRLTNTGYIGLLGIDTAGASRWKNFGGGTVVTNFQPPNTRRRPSGLYTR